MTIDERTRHDMYLGLEEHLGKTVADSLMAHPLHVAHPDDLHCNRNYNWSDSRGNQTSLRSAGG